jgi:hypothetical protein
MQRNNGKMKINGKNDSNSGGQQGRGPSATSDQRDAPAQGRERAEWVRIRSDHEGDFATQITRWWRDVPHPSSHSKGFLSPGTVEEMAKRTRRIVKDLYGLNVRIRNLDEIKQAHLRLVVADWVRTGTCTTAHSIKNALTPLRRFMRCIGKRGLVPPLNDLIPTDCPLLERSSAPAAEHIDPDDLPAILDAAERIVGPLFSCQLRLMAELGASVTQVLEFVPQSARKGNWCELTHRTQRGRPTVIELTRESQKNALAVAEEIACKHPKGILREPSVTPQRAKARFYAGLKKIKMTKADVGFTVYELVRVYRLRARRDEENKIYRWRIDALLKTFSKPDVRDALKAAGLIQVHVLGPEAEGQPLGNLVAFSCQCSSDAGAHTTFARAKAVIARALGKRDCILLKASDKQVEGLCALKVFELERTAQSET